MANTFKFPNNGYEVTVLKKQDVLDCINDNIIDKEIALAIVEQCEIDAAAFINEGRWTGIPFMGNIRLSATAQALKNPEQQMLIEEAKQKLDAHSYLVFKTNLSKKVGKQIKQQKYYNYITSIAINNNKELYKKLCKEKGECYARIYLYACKHITALNNEYINISNDC